MALLVTSGCGQSANPLPQTEDAEVLIGVPESNAEAEGRGIKEFARNISIEGLVRVGNDGHAVPWLAAGWEWEADGKRLRVKLRPKVLLHDGTPLNAALAADLLQAGIAQDYSVALYPALNDVESVTAHGELDVVFSLARTSPMLLADLGMPLRKDEIGTGPYKVVTSSSTEIQLERFDQYYLGRPTIARVEIRSFDTLRTAWTSLLRGDVDFVSDVPADAVEFIRNGDVQVIPYARRYQFMMPFNARRGALRSPAVRKALNLAIDREGLIERVLQDAGTPSTGPLWPEYWAYDNTVQPYTFDQGQAVALLDAAGYPVRPASSDGPPARFRFVCLIPEGFTVLERIALEIQKSLLNVGVDMRLRAVTAEDFNTLIPNGDFDAVLNDQSSGPTPGRAYVFWRSRKTFEGPFNVFGYENADAERLFTVLNTSTNDAATRSATGRLQRVMLNDPPALFIAWNKRARAIRREFVIPEASEPIGSLWRWTVAPDARLAARTRE